MKRELRLALKTKWFEMTKSGVKKEDYRGINEYWFKRLVYDHKRVFKYLTGWDWDYLDKQSIEARIQLIAGDKLKRGMIGYKPFDVNVMTLGYPKNDDAERIVILKHKGIDIGWGKYEIGGDPNKLYFIISHGEML